MPTRRFLLGMLVVLIGATGCSSGNSGKTTDSACAGSTPPNDVSAQVASVDLYTGTAQRVLVGIEQVQSSGTTLLSYGSIKTCMTGPGNHEIDAKSSYLGATGTNQGSPGQQPAFTDPGTSRGVYQAESIDFTQAGVWNMAISADISGLGQTLLSTKFLVGSGPVLPAPGQRAIPSKNLTMGSIGHGGVTAAMVDSRAINGHKVPDPSLHQWTIAQAMAEHKPILVVFATPTYCISQFCGPATAAVLQLQKKYGNRAVFIHVEIYRDYSAKSLKQKVNQAAYQWLYRNHDLTEPWLYLIGADGVILDRWGSVWNPAEVGAELAKLPSMK